MNDAFNHVVTFGDIDERALGQLMRCKETGSPAVLCADHHVGYSQPIGGAVAYRDKISPSGVGYDIACGNKAVKTDLKADDLPIGQIMDEIVQCVSFGMGQINKEEAGHRVLSDIKKAAFEPQRLLYDLACNQFGTVGSGNHYVDLFKDEGGFLWIGVHFGSRGFGHKTATGFLAMSQGKHFSDRPKGEDMDAKPTLFDVDSYLGQAYIDAMELAGQYAYAGRDWVVGRVLKVLDTEAIDEIHNHHNFAWRERHGPTHDEYWVVRKGCTPAFDGQRGFVGGSMGDISVILKGVESDEARRSLYSTVHGAGRVMSRTEAAGKKRWVRGDDGKKRPTVIKPGKIDWPAVKQEMRTQGIELRGAGADEAPGAYKRLPEVLAAHKDSIEVLHTLTPIGVAMAGEDTYDPYKD